MTDPLEQQLRDALAAHARSVTPDNLDRDRERHVSDEVRPPARTTRSRWPGRLSVAGLAAAAVVIGGLSVGQLTDSSRTPQADPLPAASESGTPGEDTSAPPSATTRAPSSTASAPPSRTRTSPPDARRPRTTPPAPMRSSTPTPPEPTQEKPPPGRERTSSPTTERTEERRPRTMAMSKTPEPAARLRVSVAAQPAQGKHLSWSATASGTARSDSATGGVLGYTVDHGDGTTETRQVRSGCGGAVRPVKFSTGDQQHDYRRAGVFQVRVQVQYCSDGGKTESGTGTSTVQIP